MFRAEVRDHRATGSSTPRIASPNSPGVDRPAIRSPTSVRGCSRRAGADSRRRSARVDRAGLQSEATGRTSGESAAALAVAAVIRRRWWRR
ncbi:hypothetical protein, partial [Streptomyces niveus]|uniref:hypothetical protein n=1 Tax=Streptomyces niveus TaxID=193462 RepID=UPI001C3FF475